MALKSFASTDRFLAEIASPADVAPGPTVFSAVESQLGLKLEHRKGPLDVMVIDHAERVPVGN